LLSPQINTNKYLDEHEFLLLIGFGLGWGLGLGFGPKTMQHDLRDRRRKLISQTPAALLCPMAINKEKYLLDKCVA